jgi:pimeloyl-ACP methyl ester carboxylesterase
LLPDTPPGAQKPAQEYLAELVPGAEHITKTNSGHDIQNEQPQLVIDAIRRQVVGADRDIFETAGSVEDAE